MGGRSDGKSQFRSHDLSNRCGIRRRPPSGGTANYAGRVDWEAHAARGAARYEDGAGRLPDDPRRRERQLVRMAMAATSVGLAREMQDLDGSEWFHRSAAAYRESFTGDNWGRVVGSVKAGILAGDPGGDARWALAQLPSESPTARYGEALARLALGEDDVPSVGLGSRVPRRRRCGARRAGRSGRRRLSRRRRLGACVVRVAAGVPRRPARGRHGARARAARGRARNRRGLSLGAAA